MIERPRLKPHLHAEVVRGEGVFLLSDDGPVRLDGAVFEELATRLDGRATADELVASLPPEIDAAKAYYALGLLEQRGLTEPAEPALPRANAAFWASQGIAAHDALRRLTGTAVSVHAVGDLAIEPLSRLLGSLRLPVVPDGGDLAVVLAEDYLADALAEHNRAALHHRRPWLLARPVGAQIWLGPLFRPGETGCWACLAQRLRGHREIELVVEHNLGRVDRFPIPRGFTDASRQLADGMIASAVGRWVAHGRLPELEGAVLSFDLRTWQMTTHRLARQLHCAACGDPGAPARTPLAPLVLQSRAKAFTRDGGHRTASPEETLRRYEHLVSPITGLLGELHRCELDDGGLVNVYIAGDNRAVQSWTSEVLKVHFRSKSAGKGVTDVQARASGLCEAIERWSGYFQGHERRRTARFRDLGDRAVDPRAYTLYSDAQYRDRDRWNARRSRFNKVPWPFDDSAEIEWTPAWSLTQRRERLLPTSFCYYAYPSQRPVCIPDSNGCAAGNSLEEAILQGFLELVERDAMGVWWYNRIARPAVALDAFDDPYPPRLQTFLAQRERSLWVLDLTNDLGIPVFAAFSRHETRKEERIVMGFGAHLDPRIALQRAVTELNQMLSWVLPAERDPQHEEAIKDPETLHWLRGATLAEQAYLVPDARARPRRPTDYPRQWTDDLRDDVQACAAIVERRGMEVIVLDQTRPDVGMPVVKVVVPGLRHCHARLAPGRLYDVPVALGWRATACAEEQLNPIPIFL